MVQRTVEELQTDEATLARDIAKLRAANAQAELAGEAGDFDKLTTLEGRRAAVRSAITLAEREVEQQRARDAVDFRRELAARLRSIEADKRKPAIARMQAAAEDFVAAVAAHDEELEALNAAAAQAPELQPVLSDGALLPMRADVRIGQWFQEALYDGLARSTFGPLALSPSRDAAAREQDRHLSWSQREQRAAGDPLAHALERFELGLP